MKIIAIIPSRFGSSRFPGKPLIDLGGKSMIQRTYDQVKSSKLFERVIVATDDERIFQHVQGFGGEVMMTSAEHLSGTDRCGEVVNKLDQTFDYIVNVQGDEPFIHTEQLVTLVEVIKGNPPIATLIKRIEDPSILSDLNKPKVVIDAQGNALYFSRLPIPFKRNSEIKLDYYHHIGVYAFQRQVLLEIIDLAPSPLEMAESLEQLRWIENGYKIKTGITSFESMGIDHPDDIIKLKEKGLIR